MCFHSLTYSKTSLLLSIILYYNNIKYRVCFVNVKLCDSISYQKISWKFLFLDLSESHFSINFENLVEHLTNTFQLSANINHIKGILTHMMLSVAILTIWNSLFIYLFFLHQRYDNFKNIYSGEQLKVKIRNKQAKDNMLIVVGECPECLI